MRIPYFLIFSSTSVVKGSWRVLEPSRERSRRNLSSLKNAHFFHICALHAPHFLVQVAQVGAHACVRCKERESAARALHSWPFESLVQPKPRGVACGGRSREEKEKRGGRGTTFQRCSGVTNTLGNRSRCITIRISLFFSSPLLVSRRRSKDEDLPKIYRETKNSLFSVNFCAAYRNRD